MTPGKRNSRLAGFAAIFSAVPAHAEYAWNFPDPVTPLALDTLHVHNKFMLISIAIFFVVLAIMLYSIFAHRKSRGISRPISPAPAQSPR